MEQRTCEECGAAFNVSPHGQHAKYCKAACRRTAQNRKPKRLRRSEERICPVDGAVFATANGAKYCSRRCKKRAANHAQRTREGRDTVPLDAPVVRQFDCAQCGKACIKGENVAHHASRFCGYDCKSAWHYGHVEAPRLRRECAARRLERAARGAHSSDVIYGCQCAECGQPFLARKARATAYCSRACARKAHARRRRAAGRQRIGLHEIAARDGWRCGICRKAVKQGRVVPHPQAPTLDHIVPIALGGQHERENLQLAHFICNSRKSHVGVG